MSELEIDTTTPHPGHTRRRKHDETFSKMKPGQSIKTDASKPSSIATSMRSWIQRNGKQSQLRVSVVKNMSDGYTRVYMLPKPVRMADVPGRKILNLTD